MSPEDPRNNVSMQIGDAEFSVSADYLAGVFDAIGRVLIRGQKETGSPLIRYTIEFRDNGIIIGFLNDLFDHAEVRHNVFDSTQSNSKVVEVRNPSEIQRIVDWLHGRCFAKADHLAYLTKLVESDIDSPQKLSLKRAYSVLSGYANLEPRWHKHGFSNPLIEELEDQLPDPSQVEPFGLPNPKQPKDMSQEYFGGYFDGAGRISLAVSKRSRQQREYNVNPTIRINQGGAGTVQIGQCLSFLHRNGIRYTDESEVESLRVTIDAANDILDFLELIGPELYTEYPLAELFYEELLPAYKDGYHHTKQGLYEMLRAYEETNPRAADSGQRRITSDDLLEEWGDEIST